MDTEPFRIWWCLLPFAIPAAAWFALLAYIPACWVLMWLDAAPASCYL